MLLLSLVGDDCKREGEVDARRFDPTVWVDVVGNYNDVMIFVRMHTIE